MADVGPDVTQEWTLNDWYVTESDGKTSLRENLSWEALVSYLQSLSIEDKKTIRCFQRQLDGTAMELNIEMKEGGFSFTPHNVQTVPA